MSDPAPQPPIIPGYYQPPPPPAPPATDITGPSAAAPPERQKRRWLVPALAAVAILAVAAAVFFALGGPDRIRGAAVPAPQRASTTCGQVGQVADGGKTLILDVISPEAGLGPVTPENLACVLRELGMPAYVIEQIGQTRALDGRQTAVWGDLEASWTYHPDKGLNLIIHEKS